MTDTPTEKPSPIEADRLVAVALKELQRIRSTSYDPESGHYEADDILCELLSDLGYPEINAAFYQIDRWYA